MDRRIEKTKNAIREAYFELLLSGRSDKITISEIARKANIDRKTFYLHYNGIDEILKEFAQDRLDDLIQRLKDQASPGQPIPVDLLFSVLNHILEENIAFFRFIAMNQKYDYFFDRLKELFVQVIVHDYQQYFSYPDAEFRIYADYFVAGILSAYMRWIREELPVTVDQLAALVQTAAYGGLKSLLPKQLQ